MAIPEPDSALWNDVRPHTEWPATDELIMQDLARAWGKAGAAFERVGAKPPDPHLADGWGDGNGQRFSGKVSELRNLVWKNGVEMTHLGWLAQEYGYDVGHTKTEIRKLIAANDDTYANMNGIFGLFGDTEGRATMVAEIANSINLFLRQMAERIAARGRGAPQPPRTAFVPRDPSPATPNAAVGPMPNGGLGGSNKPELSPSQQRSVGSYERLIAEHTEKLEAYKRDPWAFDNKGLLRNAPNDEVRQRIIDARVRHLEKEIRTFQENVDKIYRGER